MVNIEFIKAMKFVLKWEGGYTNDPNDPGGETKYGISKRSYPDLDIKNLTIEEATDIYYQNYWLKAGCDNVLFPFNLIFFDTAVNCGVERAKRFSMVCKDWQDYLFLRIEYYTKLENFKHFGKGWVNRVLDLYNTVRNDSKR
jgi:lysozyme family protein